MVELLGAGILNVLQAKYLLSLVIGTLAGVVGGAMPGVYGGGSAGGLITACLIGIPGTPSTIATTFDGFPMAQKGQPGRAVWLGGWAWVWGGLLGGVFLIAATGPLAAFA